jgi:hypothetical protein
MIEFFDSEKKDGLVSIYENHITFNKSLLKYFGDAYRVRVGIDKEAKKAYVFTLNKDQALSGEISASSLLPLSVSNTYARICSRAIVDYITDNMELKVPLGKYLRFKASYDEAKKAIVIKFKEGEI